MFPCNRMGDSFSQHFSLYGCLFIHYEQKISVTSKEDARIVRPVHRQTWQLDHSDIVGQKTIGKGEFGEVRMVVSARSQHSICRCKRAQCS